MTEPNNMEANRRTVDTFMSAWGAGDVERVMDLFADDATFYASVGPEPGRTLVGRASIQPAVASMLANASTMRLEVTGVWGYGSDYVAAWTINTLHPAQTGKPIVGIDRFVVSEGRILVKDAFRKVFG